MDSIAITVPELVDYIREHYPRIGAWPDETLVPWICYHAKEGFILACHDGSQTTGAKVAGIIIVRPLMYPQDAFDGYTFDNEGPCLYVAGLVSKGRDTLRALAVAVHQRFGRRKSIAYHRRSDNKLIVRPTEVVARRVFKYVPA